MKIHPFFTLMFVSASLLEAATLTSSFASLNETKKGEAQPAEISDPEKPDTTSKQPVPQRTSFRYIIGMDFDNYRGEEESDSLFEDPDYFVNLAFINSDLDSAKLRRRGQTAMSFSFFYENKPKAAKEGEENTPTPPPPQGSLPEDLQSATTAGMGFEINFWPKWPDGTLNDFLNLTLKTEQYIDVDDSDEIISDYYVGLGVSPRFDPDKTPGGNSFGLLVGYAQLENLEEEDRFYAKFQYDRKLVKENTTSVGLSVEYSTPLGSSTDGEDTFQVRAYTALAPETIASWISGEKQ